MKKKARSARISRKTSETNVSLSVKLEGAGQYRIETNEPFLTHMLEQLSKHSGIDIVLKAKGDVSIDSHHLAEDLGIAIGKAINEALGNKRGIRRFGSAGVLDEALVRVAIDFSGRPYSDVHLKLPTKRIGTFDTELVEEFFNGFARGGCMTVHIDQLKGRNTHHLIEAAFKGLATSLRDAVSVVGKGSPSTKGMIEK